VEPKPHLWAEHKWAY